MWCFSARHDGRPSQSQCLTHHKEAPALEWACSPLYSLLAVHVSCKFWSRHCMSEARLFFFISAAQGAKNALLPSAVSWYFPSQRGAPPSGLTVRDDEDEVEDEDDENASGEQQKQPNAAVVLEDDGGGDEESGADSDGGGGTEWSDVTDASDDECDVESEGVGGEGFEEDDEGEEEEIEDEHLRALASSITAADEAGVMDSLASRQTDRPPAILPHLFAVFPSPPPQKAFRSQRA
jgi:hypothetical protein